MALETFLKLYLQSLSLIKSKAFLSYISRSVSEDDCRLFFMKDNTAVVHVGNQSNHSKNSKKLTDLLQENVEVYT
jgi:accessory colonization factor AcfC